MRPTQLVVGVVLLCAIGTVVPWVWQVKQQERAEQEAAAAWSADHPRITAAVQRISLPDDYEPVACETVGVHVEGRCWTTAIAPGDAVVDLAAALERAGFSPEAPACTPDVKRDLPDLECSVSAWLAGDRQIWLTASRDYRIGDDGVVPTGTTTVNIPFPAE